MISFTTRNRPNVLEYSLRKTREIYDGFIIVIDDNSDGNFTEEICKKYEADLIYNETRLGIPASKNIGFQAMIEFDRQFWFDDDCYPKAGFFERMNEAMQFQGHLLHLKEWSFIQEKKEYVNGLFKKLPGDLISYTGGTACFMSFRKDQYHLINGFHEGFLNYGHWHQRLTERLKELDLFVAVKDSNKYIHSFDLDGLPENFKYAFQSCMSQEERRNELKKWMR